MLILHRISDKILTIGPSSKGKGGIATVINTLSPYYESFNQSASTRSGNSFIMLMYFGACINELLYYILIKRIKIVHIHGASYGSFWRKKIIINICYFFNVKVVYHMHGGEFSIFYNKGNHKKHVDKVLKKVDIIITPTDSGKRFFSSITNCDKACVVSNMINNPHFSKQYEATPNIVKFLFLGMIGNHKGIFDLIEVIREHKNYLSNRFLLYIGGNGEIEILQNLIKKYELEDLVCFEGWVSGDKKKELLESCNVFILPSYNESFGLSNLEAMTYGMPIISTNVGGIPEVVSNNKNGFLIEPGDKNKMFKCISFFISHPEEIEKMGRQSVRIAERFYPENVIPKLQNIYEHLLCK